jgi:hypothetical protein
MAERSQRSQPFGRDRASLEAENAMARNDTAALEAIVAG